MNTIHKYPIRITETQTLLVPAGWKPFLAGPDPQGIICIWAEVDTAQPNVEKCVFVVGTGHRSPDSPNVKRVDSFNDGPFIWHIYTE